MKKQTVILLLFLLSTGILLLSSSTSLYQKIELLIGIVFLLVAFYYKNVHIIRFTRNKKDFIAIIFLVLLFHLSYFSLGFFVGFQTNPYNQNILGIIQNLLSSGLLIFSTEYLRSILIIKNQRNKPALFLSTLFLIIITIPYPFFTYSFSNKEMFFQFLLGTMLPFLMNHIYSSYLDYKTSSCISILFRLLEEVPLLLFPVLPFTNWYITGSIHLIKYLLLSMIFKYHSIKEFPFSHLPKKNSFILLLYAFVLIFATIFTSFMLGIFRYEPLAILSNSMYPTYQRGDVIVLKKLSSIEKRQLKEQEIIVFETSHQLVAHRIFKVVKQGNDIFYQTKGDNNNMPDNNFVKVQQIKGVYCFSLKYLGFPSIWLHDVLKEE